MIDRFIVQVEGIEGLPPSCATPAASGMMVQTKTESTESRRRLAMELMLAGHPADCGTCDKYLNCELQSLKQYLGCEELHVRTRSKLLPINAANPLFVHDPNKCVACGRCVRACLELRSVGVLFYKKLEKEWMTGTTADLPLADTDCRFCGACAEVCPTGAIQDKAELLGLGQALMYSIEESGVPMMCVVLRKGSAASHYVMGGPQANRNNAFTLGTATTEIYGVPGGTDAAAAYDEACRKIDKIVNRLVQPAPHTVVERIETPEPAHVHSTFDKAEFEAIVEQSKEYIRAGDIFQVVLSQRFETEARSAPFDVYRALRSVNPSPYMFYLKFGDPAAGEAFYAANCASCHGADGTGGFAPPVVGVTAARLTAGLESSIHDSVSVTEEDLANLEAFLAG